MANRSQNYTGNLVRELQLGLDSIVNHMGKQYIGPYAELFSKEKCSKAFVEYVQEAGFGTPASRSSEGESLINFDSIDQDNNPHYPIYKYVKSARVSEEAQMYNLYDNLPQKIGKEIAKCHDIAMDLNCAAILNNSTVDNWGDGVPLISTAHPIQAGGTSSNKLSPAMDLSLDAVQQAIFVMNAVVNPDGFLGDYTADKLVVPVQLKFVADVILNSRYKPNTGNNDINPVNRRQDLSGYLEWRRLTSATSWFMTTNQREECLKIAQFGNGIKTDTFQDQYTHDTISTSRNFYRVYVKDWRGIVASIGA